MQTDLVGAYFMKSILQNMQHTHNFKLSINLNLHNPYGFNEPNEYERAIRNVEFSIVSSNKRSFFPVVIVVVVAKALSPFSVRGILPTNFQ